MSASNYQILVRNGHLENAEKLLESINTDMKPILEAELLTYKGNFENAIAIIDNFIPKNKTQRLYRDIVIMRIYIENNMLYEAWDIKVKWQDRIDKMPKSDLNMNFFGEYFYLFSELLVREDEFELAINSYVKAANYFHAITDMESFIRLQLIIANKYEQLGIIGDAIFHIRSAYKLKVEHNLLDDLYELCLTISRLQLSIGREKRGLEWYNRSQKHKTKETQNVKFETIKEMVIPYLV